MERERGGQERGKEGDKMEKNGGKGKRFGRLTSNCFLRPFFLRLVMLHPWTSRPVMIVIPRLHDEAGSTSWLYERSSSQLVERSTSARRASSSSQLYCVNGVLHSSRHSGRDKQYEWTV